jgi:protease I
MIQNKQQHIKSLESRLEELGEKPSLPAQVADKYAQLKSTLSGSDEMFLLRSTLGDLQTGVVDIHNLQIKFTDPVSTAIFSQIEIDLSKYEQCLAELYRTRMAPEGMKSAKPTTSPAVKM